MQVIKKIKIDMVEKSVPPIVYAVQNDSATRVVEISLYANNIPWEVPEGSTAAVSFKKADGKTGLYDKLPDGSAAISVGTSSVSVTLAQQVVSAPGNALVSIVFYDANLNQLASFPFVVSVEEKPSQSNTVSNNYYKYQTLEEINAGLNSKANILIVDLSQDAKTASHNSKQIYDHVHGGGVAFLSVLDEYLPMIAASSSEASFGNTRVAGEVVSTVEFVIDSSGNVTTESASGGSGGGGGGTGGGVSVDEVIEELGKRTIPQMTVDDAEVKRVLVTDVGGEGIRVEHAGQNALHFQETADGNNVILRGIAPAEDDNDAVNKGQLDAVDDKIAQITEVHIETGTNLFNPAEWVTGKWMNVNGKEVTYAGFGHTGFIPVNPGDIVVMCRWNAEHTEYSAVLMATVTAYDADKKAKSDLGADNYYQTSYTVPDGIYYIVISVDGVTPNERTAINCTTDGVPLPFEPYKDSAETLYPYGYRETQKAIEEAQAGIEALEAKVETAVSSVNGHIVSSDFGTLTAGTVVELGEDIRINNNNVIEFYCKFDTFDSVTVGHGNQKQYGSAVRVDGTKIYILQNAAETVIYEYPHGLTISEFLGVVITINHKGQAEVRICTAGGDYVTAENLLGNNIWAGLSAKVFVKSTSDCNNCKLVWNMNALLKDVYLFGDSYVPLHDPAQYTTYLTNRGYTNFAIYGSPGATAETGLTQFQNVMAVRKPKLVVWALGMNNADSSAGAINANWLECTQAVIDYCAEHGVELVLATIPNVPDRINAHKNAWIKASGHRYVDFAKAVGAEEIGSSWYTDMLKIDKVHPATLGAKALAFRFLLDVPEIANNR